MHQVDIDEMAARIDGVARAVLQLAAALEISGAVDGERLAQAWRGAVAEGATQALQSSQRVLHDMAGRLDEARRVRSRRAAARSCSLVMVRENPAVSGWTQARPSGRA